MTVFSKDILEHVISQKDPPDEVGFSARISQSKLIKNFIKISVIGHIVVFSLSFLKTSFFHPKHQMDEWVIDTDLVIDQPGLLSRQESAMPRATVSDKDAVPQNLLPQLPKNVAIKNDESEFSHQGASQDAATESLKPAKKEQEAKKDEPKEELEDGGKSGGSDNLMRQEELLRRKAIEDLKKQKKFSDKYEAQKKDALARLRNDVGTSTALSGGTGSGAGASENEYRHLIQQAIQKCYTLNNYYTSDQQLTAIIFLKLTGTGEILEANLQESSGDQKYDADIVKAIYNCAPFSPPPERNMWESRLQFKLFN